jgi:hypothetical protein
MKNLILIVPILFSFLNPVKGQEGVEIFIVPALHHIHKINTNYNYDSLKTIVKRLKPDVLLVGIRPEDIAMDTAYLKRNYPIEMWAMKLWFPNHIIEGIDWLGKDIAGKPIPNNYWKDFSLLKKWEKALEMDTAMQKNLLNCESFAAERIPTLKEGTFLEIVNGDDEKNSLSYYQCLERIFFGTIHSRLSDFYKQRNISLAENIVKSINENGKGRYVIVIGADHIPFIKMYLFKKGLGSSIKGF